MFRIGKRTLELQALEERQLLAAAVTPDAVLRWNEIALTAHVVDLTPADSGIFPANTPGLFARQQGGPTRTTRALAIVQSAVFDAANAIERHYPPYLLQTPADGTASVNAAIAQAAHDALAAVYPAQAVTFDQKLAEELAAIPDGPREELGRATGRQAAAAILAARGNDGSEIAGTYTPDNTPGRHRPDPFNPNQGFLSPAWGDVKPFAVASTAAYLAPAPPALDSAAYAAALDEVRRLGSDGVVTPTERTADQTEIGIFWAYDGVPGLGAPPRLYNQIAQHLAMQENLTLMQNAQLFAIINWAMADAAISGWDAKYEYNFWRPVVAIRETDPTWTPLGSPTTNSDAPRFTPPFAAYVSGHSVMGSAFFETLVRFYGGEAMSFTLTSDELNGINKEDVSSADPRPLRPRSFTSLRQAEQENGDSRIYLGVHWRFDVTEGMRAGRLIGGEVFQEKAERVISPQELLIHTAYRECLDRRPEEAGLRFWISQLGQGASISDVILGIRQSHEFHERTVESLFRDFLDREADAGGRQTWIAFLEQGGSSDILRQRFLTSEEYMARHRGELLASLYQDVLGRELDASGQATFGAALDNGVAWRDIVATVARSDEGLETQVAQLYVNCLGRAPDESGQATFVGALRNGANPDAVFAMIAGSIEAVSRVTGK